MSSTVFILGAGASKLAGAPLMNDFLDVAHDLWRLDYATGDFSKPFETVFKGISQLQRVHSKSRLDINNIESVFAAFEMAKTLCSFAEYSAEDIDALLKALRQLIVLTLQRTMKLPVINPRFPEAPAPYGQFVEMLYRLTKEARPQETVSVLTFNYDMGLDFAFFKYDIPIDYSLGVQKTNTMPLLKLHGSLNWATCSKCNAVVPWALNEYFSKHHWHFLERHQQVTFSIGTHLTEFVHCEQKVMPDPILIPPTWNKTEHHRSISSVWARAAHELGEAQNVFVIGYSLPNTDEFFRYLYALGTVGNQLLKRFWVFNPDDSGEIESRFKKLLGPGAETRLRYFPKTFKESITIINDEFMQKSNSISFVT